MITRIDFKKEHMEYLLNFQAEEYRKFVSAEMMQFMEDEKRTFTAVNDAGEIIVCGGIRKLWDGRGELWALFNNIKGSYCKSLHKIIMDLIEHSDVKRIEMVVYLENALGHKLAKVLGFKLESERLIAYRPDGGDVSMYVRIAGIN